MSSEIISSYTEAEYNSLTREEQEILLEVGTHLIGNQVTITDDETLQSTFNILRPCDGSIPEDEVGEDFLADIRRKFACVYYTAIERAENQLKTGGLHIGDDFSFCLVIDPSYDGLTYVAIVDLWPEVRPFCYLYEFTKAWHFSFASLKDITQKVLRAEKIIITTLLRVKDSAQPHPNREESR